MSHINPNDIEAKLTHHADERIKTMVSRGRVQPTILFRLLAQHIEENTKNEDFDFRFVGRGMSQSEVIMLVTRPSGKFVIKCGPKEEIEIEGRHWQTVQRLDSRVRPERVMAPQFIDNYGSVRYSLGTHAQECITFAEAIDSQKYTHEILEEILAKAFNYLYTWDEKKRCVKADPPFHFPWREQGRNKILHILDGQDQIQSADLKRLGNLTAGEYPQDWLRSSLESHAALCHGDLNVGNLLIGVDEWLSTHPCLIDFAWVTEEYSPALDYAKLERDLRFRCLRGATKVNNYGNFLNELDNSLSSVLEEAPGIPQSKLWKVFKVIRFIRTEYEKRLNLSQEEGRVAKVEYVFYLLCWSLSYLDTLEFEEANPIHQTSMLESIIRISKCIDELIHARRSPAVKAAIHAEGHDHGVARRDYSPLGEGHDLGGIQWCGSSFSGRKQERERLDEIYGGQKARIVCVHGKVGGEGKSQLVVKWLKDQYDKSKGKSKICCFSFNGQGTSEAPRESSAHFFEMWLPRLGILQMADSQVNAQNLANAIRRDEVILCLDGLESLQETRSDGSSRLKDQGIRALIDNLACGGRHFCLITTRVPSLDIQDPDIVELLQLGPLEPEDAVKLLKSYGIYGEDDKQLFDAAEEWKRHALSLNLLASYLNFYCHKDIRKRDRIPPLFEADNFGSVPYETRRMLVAHEKELEKTGNLELFQLLRIISLFDRAVSEDEVVVVTSQSISNLSNRLTSLKKHEHRSVIRRLQDLGLISKAQSSSMEIPVEAADIRQSSERYIDCHALIRQYIREQVRHNFPEAWTRGKSLLFDYFRRLPKQETPDAPEELDMLYEAVAHGCGASLYAQAFSNVYWPRISRGKKFFSTGTKGLFDKDLVALSCFFDGPSWIAVRELDRDSEIKAEILGLAGFRLQTVGRLDEAMDTTEQALIIFKREPNPNWEMASSMANNLAVQNRMQGNLAMAVALGDDALRYSKFLEDKWHLHVHRMAALAESYHYSNELDRALDLFRNAERLQREHHPARPFLTSTLGFRYCELLLTLGKFHEVKERARVMAPEDDSVHFALNLGLAALCEGRALIEESDSDKSILAHAEKVLRKSWDHMKFSQYRDNQVRTAIALAQCLRLQKDFHGAEEQVREGARIASFNGMHLHRLDCDFEGLQIRASQYPSRSILQEFERLAQQAKGMHYGLLFSRASALARS